MKKNYTQPQLECIEFKVELGFAISARLSQEAQRINGNDQVINEMGDGMDKNEDAAGAGFF